MDPLKKENCIPVSLPTQVPKVLERIIITYIEDKLPKYLTGSRNSHGTQHLLATMLGKKKKAVNKGECVFALFLDLSKAFGIINHKPSFTSKIKGLQILIECTKINP